MATSLRNPYWQALNIAWELGYTIAIPLVLLALGGRWADTTFHTSPWMLLGGVVLAILSSSFLLVRKFSRLMRDMNPVRTTDAQNMQHPQPPSRNEDRSNGMNPPQTP